MTFQAGFGCLAPGWAVPKVAGTNENFSDDAFLGSIVSIKIEY
jgi:hypothetical protein